LFDLISSAPDILESAIAKLAGSQNEHIYARLGKIDGVFEKISHIGRPLIRNNYFRHLAKVLGENLRDIQIEFDKYCQLKRKNIQKSGDQNQPQVLSGKSGGENKKIEISDLLLLRVFLNFPVLLYENQEILTHLPHPDIQSIAEQILRAFGDNKNIEVVELIRQMKLPRNSRFLPFLMRLLQEDEHIEQKDAQTAISEYLKSKDQEKHSVEFRSIKQQIRDAEKVGDIHGIRVFLQKQSQKLHENRKLNSLEGLE